MIGTECPDVAPVIRNCADIQDFTSRCENQENSQHAPHFAHFLDTFVLHTAHLICVWFSFTGSTVVLTCCKGDSSSRWETSVFGPPQTVIRVSDGHFTACVAQQHVSFWRESRWHCECVRMSTAALVVLRLASCCCDAVRACCCFPSSKPSITSLLNPAAHASTTSQQCDFR